MSSPAWNKRPAPQRRLRGVLAVLTLALLAACSSHAHRANPPPVAKPSPAAAPAPPATPAAPGAAAGNTAAAPAGAAAVAAPRPDVPPAARADFDRAVKYMRAGNATEAELGFKQIALQYPQFATPLVDLALLQRKQGQLEQAEESLKNAVAHESGNALAWTELGVTQRMRGRFKDAAASYEQAIAADPRYAPAWRNLGVLADLYMGDPKRALAAFEQYKAITGEEKPVNGWIAELRQRLGIKAPESGPQAPGAAAPADSPGAAPTSAPAPGATPPPTPGGAAPANAAAAGATPQAGG
jgi:tetratricopeptide (TPR) repeat protein